jgi:DNA primase catalytic core
MSYNPIRISGLAPVEREFIYGASRLSLFQPEGWKGRRYLMDERGIDVGTISEFRVGYVPESVDHVFSGRVVMPIFDQYGRLIALSVRGTTDDCEPKYWNESYPKGENVFGLNNALRHVWDEGYIILVEGQFDVMSMHASGFKNTCGVLGGAFTPMQAQVLRRYVRQIVFLFDGDAAGKEHAERAEVVLEAYNTVSRALASKSLRHCVVTLPDETDPDSFVRDNGSIEMRKVIESALFSGGMKKRKSAHGHARRM